ncbi:MAG: hydrogenase maturation protease [Chloroflexi bacterium]|nr:hydrogenase maturation protease [Chloroflexota bacterium]
MAPMALVLGLGNPLRGDDGIGPQVVEALLRRGLPDGVEALDAGSAGLGLLNLLDGPQRVIVIDAADVGLAPGQFVRFTPDDAHLLAAGDTTSFHQAGLTEALALARALDRPLPEIVIFGVQPASMEWGEGLSPAVEGAVTRVVEAVLQVLDVSP